VKQQLLENVLGEIAALADGAVNQPDWKQHETLLCIWVKARQHLPLQKRPVEGLPCP